MLDPIRRRLDKRAHRKAYRAMVRRWYADGGDDRYRFDYPLTRDSLVFDLGGYQGQWASDLYARRPCRIAVFEPVARFAQAIDARFAHNPDIAVYDCGLGATTRSETIRLRGASSSAFKDKGTAEQMRLVDVAEWLADNGIEAIDLMKINIEGGEFELLERLIETKLVARIRDLQIQFHRVGDDPDRRMAGIQQGLAATHTPSYEYRYVWENWTRKADREDQAQ